MVVLGSNFWPTGTVNEVNACLPRLVLRTIKFLSLRNTGGRKMKVYALDIGGSSVKHALINTNGGTPGISKRFDSLQLASKDFVDLRDVLITATREVLSNDSDGSTV